MMFIAGLGKLLFEYLRTTRMKDNALISKTSLFGKKYKFDWLTEDLSGRYVARDGIKIACTTFNFNFLTFYA